MTPRGRRRRPVYEPLDLRCRECAAPPGLACTWRDSLGSPHPRRPHAERVLDARDETASAYYGTTARRRASASRLLPPGWRSWADNSGPPQ